MQEFAWDRVERAGKEEGILKGSEENLEVMDVFII